MKRWYADLSKAEFTKFASLVRHDQQNLGHDWHCVIEN